MEKTIDLNVKVPVAAIVDELLSRFGAKPSASVPAGNVPRIGEYWPGQGGVNAGLMRGVNGEPDYYLIVPKKDQVSFGQMTWGPRPKAMNGADDQFDGKKNTQAILASDGDYPAAAACYEFKLDGHADYYLGARREYALAYANVPELFETSDWYWTSTHYSDDYAWGQHFYYGSQNDLGKGGEYFVRPVRRLPANLVL